MHVKAVLESTYGFKIKSYYDAKRFLYSIVQSMDSMSFEDNGKCVELFKDKNGWHLTEEVFNNGIVGISVEKYPDEWHLVKFVYKYRKRINREFFSEE